MYVAILQYVVRNDSTQRSLSTAECKFAVHLSTSCRITTDGAITAVEVTGFQKRIKPEKFYVSYLMSSMCVVQKRVAASMISTPLRSAFWLLS